MGQGWNQCPAEVQCQEPGVDVAGRAGRRENPEQRPELLASGLALLWPSWELLLVTPVQAALHFLSNLGVHGSHLGLLVIKCRF